MEENMYPLNGHDFVTAEPSAQVDERQQEIADTLLVLPLLKEVIDHMNQRLAFYSSLESIAPDLLTKPDEFMHVVAGNKLAHDNLIVERDYLLARVKDASKG